MSTLRLPGQLHLLAAQALVEEAHALLRRQEGVLDPGHLQHLELEIEIKVKRYAKICITSCTTPSLSSSSLILLARAAVTLVGTTIKLIIMIVTIIITTIKHYLEGTTIKLIPAVWESTSLWQAITDSHMSSSLGFLASMGSLPKFI